MTSINKHENKNQGNGKIILIAIFIVILFAFFSLIIFRFSAGNKPGITPPLPSAEKVPEIKESARLLMTIDPDLWKAGNYTVSPDSRHIAYIKPVEGGKIAVLDGKEQKQFDDVIAGGEIPFVFSPDSSHLSYIARQGKDEMAVIDGKEGKKYRKISRRVVTFSPDSITNAYVAEEDNQKLAVINGVEGDKYVHILQEFIFFSPDSKRIAYTMKTNTGRLMYLDGKVLEGKHFYVLNGRLFFTPDSRQVVYVDKSRDGYYSFLRAGDREYKKYYGSALFIKEDILDWDVFLKKLKKRDTPQLKEIWKAFCNSGESPLLNTTEILDWTGLLTRLQNRQGTDGKIYDLMGEQSKMILGRWTPDIGAPRPMGQSFIVEDFNTIIDNPKLFDILEGSLDAKDRQALEKELGSPGKPSVSDKDRKRETMMFNRLLLQKIYPREIAQYADAKIIIDSWEPGKMPDDKSKEVIIGKLNKILETPDFYRAKVFRNLKVDDEFKDVFGMTMGKTRVNPVLRGAYDNRLIFDTVFSDSIAKNYFFCFGLDPTLVFSPDSKKIAYKVRVNNKWVVVFDEKEEKGYDAAGIPVFSPDGNRTAFAAREGNEQFVVIDGKEGKHYEAIGSIPVFSPDSRHVAYCAMEKGKKFVVIDGVEGKKYDNIVKENTVIRTDVIQKTEMVRESDKLFSVLVKKEHNDMFVYRNTVVFSPDSRRTAYIAREGDKEFVVLDGMEQEKYDEISTLPIFSPDGKLLVYAAGKDKARFVVVNGRELKHYSEIITKNGGRILFDSPDTFHYLSRENNEIYIVEENTPE